MGFLTFLILVIVTLALAAGALWIINRFIQNPPSWVPIIIWGVALFIIFVTLIQVTGVWEMITKYDPKIPKV